MSRRAAVMSDVLPSVDEAQLFRRALRVGFAGVELIVRRDRPDQLESARRAQQETGLAVPSLVLGEHSDHGGVADDDVAVAEAAAADVHRALGWAGELGADALLVPFFGRAELRDEADVRRAAAALRPLCEVAGERGVELLYEGTLPADGIRQLASLVGSKAFGCYFDTANVVARGLDSATELQLLGELVRRIHIKDVRSRVNDCPPGLGLVDFRAVAAALDELGYEGWIVLETPPGPPELVGRDLSFVRSVIAGLALDDEWPRLGIFTRHAPDWETLVEDCRRLGLRAVQLDGDLLTDALEHPARAAALDEAGIQLAGIGGYQNLVTPDEPQRRANVEYLGRCLELAPRLGTSVVATETGTRNPEQPWAASPENRSPQALADLEESLAELLAVAERHGSILAVEGYVGHVLGTHAALQGVLDRFPTPSLQLVLDPYNYLSRHLLPAQARVTQTFLDRHEHRFVIAHAKDVAPGGAEESTPELGTGVFEQGPYLAFLERRRPDLPLILEHLPLEHVADAAGRVRRTAGAGYRSLRRRGEHLAQSPAVSALAEPRTAGGVPLRVFLPDQIDGVYLHLHGGGFVYGSASLQDDRLERLANTARVAVVSVEYRLAPEHPYPAAADDCETVALWLVERAASELGSGAIAVGGESAGANLAVVTMVRLRDRHGFSAFRAAALSSGVFDLSEPSDAELDHCFAQYAAGAPRSDPDLSPLRADLRGLPPAVVVVGSDDPLRDDSLALAERWVAAGNSTRLVVVSGGAHGDDTTPEVASFLTETLAAA